MPEYAYDLHIHTCLSPCADKLMTPPNIVNMAYIKGLDIIAVTDHNASGNAGAVMRAAKELPLTVIPGMELTTAEEIHVICLFPDLESAQRAGEYVYAHLPPIKNKPQYFGDQILMDENENFLATIDLLLSNASDISYEKLPDIIDGFGGFCWPAHIDRMSNSVLSVFGVLPELPNYSLLEVHDPDKFFENKANEAFRRGRTILTNSDAHMLEMISEKEHFIELSEPSFAALKAALCK